MGINGTYRFTIERGCPHCSMVVKGSETLRADIFGLLPESSEIRSRFACEEMIAITECMEIEMAAHIASDHKVL